MEEHYYPDELRTPPVPLVALVGVPELHSAISSHLHTEPLPINTLALPDFSKLSVIGGKERKPVDAKLPEPTGILKIDWLWKHRTKVPAALVVLLTHEEVFGDPTQWLQVCTNLDNVKNLIRGRNTKLVVAVVQPVFLSGDIGEDRLMTLRKRAEIDSKCFLTVTSQEPSELKKSLSRLGNILNELVTIFYKEEGRRVRLRLEKKAFTSLDLGVRYNFKVAVYAEFRRDWVEALKFYETAYTLLQEIVTTQPEIQSIQRLVEVKTVAEVLHFKVLTLLLHGGKEAEAVKWFRQHVNFYKHYPGPPDSIFLHWSWLGKQFFVFGVLLQNSLTSSTHTKSGSSVLPESAVTERELHPGYYYQMSAHCVIERRSSFQLSSFTHSGELNADVLEGPPDVVGSPLYVGQSVRILTRSDSQCPTDQEYMYHAAVQEKIFPHSVTVINLLKRAYEHYKLIKAGRMGYLVASEMGREYFHAREYANAKQLFDTVAGMYRQEAWTALLWATLGFLRECARQLGLLQDYIEYSLEMATLPTSDFSDGVEHIVFTREVGPAGPLSHAQREQVFLEVLNLINGKHSILPPRDGESGLSIADAEEVLLSIDVASPLRSVLGVCAAFQEQTVKQGFSTSLNLSLITRLPQPLEIERLEVFFNQSSCNLVLVRTQEGNDSTVETRVAPNLKLQPNKWERFSIEIVPGQSGKLECLSITAHVGRFARISSQAESPASREEVSFWKFEPHIGMSPMGDSMLSYFGQRTIQVEDPDPLVDVYLEAMHDGPSLLGELFPVLIRIIPRGQSVHSGELKFSVVENSKQSVPSSPQTPQVGTGLVELYAVDTSRKAKEPEFEKFNGVIHIPAIASGSNFLTQIYIRWVEAKPVSVLASFSFASEAVSSIGANHPFQFFVHKVLQLQCEDPFTVSHQYMGPYRRDSLLLANFEKGPKEGGTGTHHCIAAKETSTLVLTLENRSTVMLQLISITLDRANGSSCLIREADLALGGRKQFSGYQRVTSTESEQRKVTMLPGEALRNLFFVQPLEANPALAIGTVQIKWQRLHQPGLYQYHTLEPETASKIISLPLVQVENPVLIATFNCPPNATVGIPFDLSVCLENATALIQEVNFSIIDSPAFILSGAHSDTVHVLPYSKDVISCRVVSIASGLQQLPQFNIIAARYNATLHQSVSSTQIFVFPSSESK